MEEISRQILAMEAQASQGFAQHTQQILQNLDAWRVHNLGSASSTESSSNEVGDEVDASEEKEASQEESAPVPHAAPKAEPKATLAQQLTHFSDFFLRETGEDTPLWIATQLAENARLSVATLRRFVENCVRAGPAEPPSSCDRSRVAVEALLGRAVCAGTQHEREEVRGLAAALLAQFRPQRAEGAQHVEQRLNVVRALYRRVMHVLANQGESERAKELRGELQAEVALLHATRRRDVAMTAYVRTLVAIEEQSRLW